MRTLADHSDGDLPVLVACRGYYTGWTHTVAAAQGEAVAKSGGYDRPGSAVPAAGGKWSRGARVDSSDAPRQTPQKKGHSAAYSDSNAFASNDDAGSRECVPLLCSHVRIAPLSAAQRPPRVQLALENERYKTALCQDWERTGAMLSVKNIRRPKDLLNEIRARHKGCPADEEVAVVSNWAESTRLRQHCEFRRGMSKCHFAHGPVELRPKGLRTIGATGRLVCGPVVDRWGADVTVDDCGRFDSGGIDVYRDARVALTAPQHPPASGTAPCLKK